jgi:hypothetical protein
MVFKYTLMKEHKNVLMIAISYGGFHTSWYQPIILAHTFNEN